MGDDLVIRCCENVDDLRLVQSLVAAVWSADGPRTTLHVGDVVWRYCRHPRPVAAALLPMWVDRSGRAVACAVMDPAGGADVAVHPDYRSESFMASILDVIEQRRRGALAGESRAGGLTVGCFEGDTSGEKLLTGRGYRATGKGYVHLLRRLDNLPGEVGAPAGYRVGAMGTRERFEQTLAAGRAVYGRSNLDSDRYARMMAAGFSPDQDVTAVDGDGRVVAACIWWYDPVSRAGELEPVGCHPDHRRRGLGRAVVLEALRRLRSVGGGSAVVYAGSGNEAALAFYESCGFGRVAVDRDFHKPLPPSAGDCDGA
jgi:ribosomal protein S18 acetylase RimI-like enzyme